MITRFLKGLVDILSALFPLFVVIASITLWIVLIAHGPSDTTAATPEKENAVPSWMTIEKVEFEGRTYVIFRSFYGNSDMHVIAQP